MLKQPKNTKTKQPKLLAISPTNIAIATFLSFGFYNVYWSSRNAVILKNSLFPKSRFLTGKCFGNKYSNAVFAYAYKKSNEDKQALALSVAHIISVVIFILVLLTPNTKMYGLLLLFIYLSVVSTIYYLVQKKIIDNDLAANDSSIKETFGTGGIAISIVGLLVGMIIILGIIGNIMVPN